MPEGIVIPPDCRSVHGSFFFKDEHRAQAGDFLRQFDGRVTQVDNGEVFFTVTKQLTEPHRGVISTHVDNRKAS